MSAHGASQPGNDGKKSALQALLGSIPASSSWYSDLAEAILGADVLLGMTAPSAMGTLVCT
jgi:hypothetical protein